MPFEVHRVNHECKTCKNPTTFKTPKGYFCRLCLETELYGKPEINEPVIVMPDTMIENVKQDEQIQVIAEAIETETSQPSIEDVTRDHNEY